MELIKVELVNILSHRHTEISFDSSGKCTTIIGPNGSGKSNIRRAISLVLENWPNSIEQNKYDNFWDKYSDSRILLTFRLNKVTQRIIKQWLFLSAISVDKTKYLQFELEDAINSSSILSLVVGYKRNNRTFDAVCICKCQGLPYTIPGRQGFVHMENIADRWQRSLKLPTGIFSYTLMATKDISNKFEKVAEKEINVDTEPILIEWEGEAQHVKIDGKFDRSYVWEYRDYHLFTDRHSPDIMLHDGKPLLKIWFPYDSPELFSKPSNTSQKDLHVPKNNGISWGTSILSCWSEEQKWLREQIDTLLGEEEIQTVFISDIIKQLLRRSIGCHARQDNMVSLDGEQIGIGRRIELGLHKILNVDIKLVGSKLKFKKHGNDYGINTIDEGTLEVLQLLLAIENSQTQLVLLDDPGQSLHPPKKATLLNWLISQYTEKKFIIITHASEMITESMLSNTYRCLMKGGVTKLIPFTNIFNQKEDYVKRCKEGQASRHTKAAIKQFLVEPNSRQALFAEYILIVEGFDDQRLIGAYFELRQKLALDSFDKQVFIWPIGSRDKLIDAVIIAEALSIGWVAILDYDAILHDNDPSNWKSRSTLSPIYKVIIDVLQKSMPEFHQEDYSEELASLLRTKCKQHGILTWSMDLEKMVLNSQPSSIMKYFNSKDRNIDSQRGVLKKLWNAISYSDMVIATFELFKDKNNTDFSEMVKFLEQKGNIPPTVLRHIRNAPFLDSNIQLLYSVSQVTNLTMDIMDAILHLEQNELKQHYYILNLIEAAILLNCPNSPNKFGDILKSPYLILPLWAGVDCLLPNESVTWGLFVCEKKTWSIWYICLNQDKDSIHSSCINILRSLNNLKYFSSEVNYKANIKHIEIQSKYTSSIIMVASLKTIVENECKNLESFCLDETVFNRYLVEYGTQLRNAMTASEPDITIYSLKTQLSESRECDYSRHIIDIYIKKNQPNSGESIPTLELLTNLLATQKY